jgi:TolA-binding protein
MTVKELAIICKVHYNTMRKWLSDNKVKKVDNAVNSPYLITDDVVKKAKKHFLTEDPELENKEEKVEKIDNILIQQLTQKDKQIVEQQEQIKHLQKLLENQQILTLKAQEKVFLLENKEDTINNNKEKDKSLWQKIFKKDRR